jgi:hypothetical protein
MPRYAVAVLVTVEGVEDEDAATEAVVDLLKYPHIYDYSVTHAVQLPDGSEDA